MTATADSTTSGFGRGILLLASANGVYVLAGYLSTTLLARLLDPAAFGSFGLVMGWITLLTALLVKGLGTSIAREVAAGVVEPATAWRAGAGAGLRLGVALAVVGVAVSPAVARLFDSPEHVEQYVIGALGAITFGANAVLLAWPTGTRDYARQALTQGVYAIARLVLVLAGGAYAGLGGAVVGYVLAPLVACVPLLVRHPAATGAVAAARSRILSATVPVALTSLAVTSYFVVDVFALGAVTEGGSSAVGVYVAYGTIAHVPFFLLQATSVAMVPAISGAADAARSLAVRRTLSDSLVLLAGPTLLLAVAGDAAARLVFGAEYHIDQVLVAPLAVATAAVTVMAALVAVDVAHGQLRMALAICGGGAAALAVACVLAGAGGGTVAAARVAWATLGVCVLAAGVLAIATRARRGRLIDGRRVGAGVMLAAVWSLPVLLVDHDLARVALAAACGAGWIFSATRARLIDLRRD